MTATPPPAPPPDRNDAEMAARALRAALRHFEDRLQSQEAQVARTQRQLQKLARREPAAATALPGGTAAPGRLPPGRRTLLVLARRLRRLLPRVWRGALVERLAQPAGGPDYRNRLRALSASGRLAGVRRVGLIAPARLKGVAQAVADLLDGMSLHGSVHSRMPASFTDDLYLVLSPGAFPHLPPAERRILWLVEAGEPGAEAADWQRLFASLAVFEARAPRIATLLAGGLVQHQIFHVPLPSATASSPAPADRSPFGLPHMLARALHGCGVLDDAGFEAATAETDLDAPAFVLCLPEAPERFAHAGESRQHGARLFPGLRHIDGWKGTALSYRYLARRALQAGRPHLVVWEDDARLPADFADRLPALLAFLQEHAGAWDLFSGLISDLSAQAHITALRPYGEDLLIELDTVIGMVFGIYGPEALQALAAYRVEGEDVMRDTIDRHLERLGLRCWTLFPPLVGHADHLSSTLWDVPGQRFLGNDRFNPMIDRSQLRLLAKIADRLAAGNDDGPPA
ncbi:hypothetical protein [Ancylobacter sp. IITR112]|uniref:hypothetical protein n=1 Tax=Ancylobacter sp. IITR112 TaxID=3138073 RepID=UPI00352B3F52